MKKQILSALVLICFISISMLWYSCQKENNYEPTKTKVLGTENIKPEDSLTKNLPITEENLFQILVHVTDLETGKLLKADLTVKNRFYLYNQELDSVLNNIVTVQSGYSYYIFKVEKDGYIPYINEFTESELMSYANTPLNIEIEDTIVSSVTDYDGNKYKTVYVGSQIWMGENLRTLRYNDGADIPLLEDPLLWSETSSGAYCWYNNDKPTNEIYGPLYNWYVVNTGKLCPTGWHIPSEEEVMTFITYLGGYEYAGGKIKEPGLQHWESPNADATNETGFTALPNGFRNPSGNFVYQGLQSGWWSSTYLNEEHAFMWGANYFSGRMGSAGNYQKTGMAIRCIKDKD